MEATVRPVKSLVLLGWAAPAGKRRSSSAAGCTPPQLAGSLQRLFGAAPVQVRVFVTVRGNEGDVLPLNMPSGPSRYWALMLWEPRPRFGFRLAVPLLRGTGLP